MVLERRDAETLDLAQDVVGGRVVEHTAEVASHHPTDDRERLRADTTTTDTGAARAEDATVVEVERREGPDVRSDASPQRAHASSIGWKPSSERSFQKKAALTSGDGSRASVCRALVSIR